MIPKSGNRFSDRSCYQRPVALPPSGQTETPMPQNITTSAKSLVEAAEREIENLSVEDAVKLHGRDDVVLVDIRDPRELQRDGKVPGAFHCPRGMLEFWIDPASSYHKPKFARGQALRVLLRRRLALGAGSANGTAHGAEAGGAHPGRLRRLEERRRAGRGAGASEAEGVMSNNEPSTAAASVAAPVPPRNRPALRRWRNRSNPLPRRAKDSGRQPKCGCSVRSASSG